MLEFRLSETKRLILNPVKDGAKAILSPAPKITIRRLTDNYYWNGGGFVAAKTQIDMTRDVDDGFYYYNAAIDELGVFAANMISTDATVPLDEIQYFCIRHAQTRLFVFPTDQTQKNAIVKGDTIDFVFDFLEDVTGWKFMFQLTDPASDEVIKKASALVSGGDADQIEIETGSTFSRVFVHIDMEETEDFSGIYAGYELQYQTDSGEQGSIRGRITFAAETIDSSWSMS